MISASHNPFGDNGIKLFAPGRPQAHDEVEERLEAELDRLLDGRADAATTGAVGEPASTRPPAGLTRYAAAVVASLEGRTSAGLHRRRRLRQRRGLERRPRPCCGGSAPRSTSSHADPDGRNINAGCGSTHPAALQAGGRRAGRRRRPGLRRRRRPRARRRRRRARWSTATTSSPSAPSTAIDRGALADDTVVVTVMTNLGFRLAHGRRTASRSSRPRWATATCSRPSRTGGWSLGGRAVGPRDLPRPGHHRRRPADRRPGARPRAPAPAGRWPTWPPSR